MYLLCFRMIRIQKQLKIEINTRRGLKSMKKQKLAIAFHKMLANKHGKLLMF